MSLRAIERELGIHRSTIKKYLDAEVRRRGDPQQHQQRRLMQHRLML